MPQSALRHAPTGSPLFWPVIAVASAIFWAFAVYGFLRLVGG